MRPPLLAVCGLDEATVWRTSSAAVAVVMVSYGATYPMRRGAIVAGHVPRKRWMPIITISTFVIIALIGNAVGFPYSPAVGPVAVAATWTLGCGAMVFVLALNALWNEAGERVTTP
jgi:hypothetical protein